jgi:hypothetical protein
VLDVAQLLMKVSATVDDPDTKQPARFLVPGDPDHSRIYVRAMRGEMPPPDVVGLPANPRPSVSDLSVLQAWIAHCLEEPNEQDAGTPPDHGTSAPGATHAATNDDVPASAGAPDVQGGNGGQASAKSMTGGAGAADAGLMPGAAPCASLCSNPREISVPPRFEVDNLDDAADCFETRSVPSGWECGNLAMRPVRINGVAVDCAMLPSVASVPARNGGYCFEIGADPSSNVANRQTRRNKRAAAFLAVF